MMILVQIIMLETAGLETLSQDCLNTKSSSSVARYHGWRAPAATAQSPGQVQVPGVLVAVADDHIVHTPKGGPQVSLYRE